MATYIPPNVKSDTSSLKAVPLPENRPRGSREERKERTRRRHALWEPEERGAVGIGANFAASSPSQSPHHPGPLLPSPSPRPGEEGEQPKPLISQSNFAFLGAPLSP